MEKLLAERRQQAQEPTVDYVPKSSRWSRRSLLVLALAAGLIILALTIWGALAYVKSRNPVPAQESLQGLKIGDRRDDVIARLGKPQREWHGKDPGPRPDPEILGRVFYDSDLEGDRADATEDDFLFYADNRLSLLLRHNVIRAIVVRVRHKAPTARGLDVGDSEAQLIHLYPEIPSSVRGASAAGGPTIKIYRFDNLGIGFEVGNEHVVAITLYPAKAAPKMVGD
jgi:hypothetical protein